MGRKIALLIENTDYIDGTYNGLPKLNDNGKEVEKLLLDDDRCGFEVTALRNPTRSSAEKYIFDLLKHGSEVEIVALYMRGYCLQDVGNDLYFLLRETEHNALEVTSISTAFITQLLMKNRAGSVVIFLECPVIRVQVVGELFSIEERIDIARIFQGSRSNCAIISASTNPQYTIDQRTGKVYGTEERSDFSHYLIEGIKEGSADSNADGEITIGELFSYIHHRTLTDNPLARPQKHDFGQSADVIFAHNLQANQLAHDLVVALQDRSPFARIGAIQQLEYLLYQRPP